MAKNVEEIRFKAEQKRRQVIVFAIILLLFGVTLVIAGTYAYYQKTMAGTINGTIATWSFTANNQASTFSVSILPTQTSATLNNTVAPGTTGSFSIVLKNNSTSPLTVDYDLTFSGLTNIPTNMVFYTDSARTVVANMSQVVEGTIAAGGTITKTWYWAWPYGSAGSVTNDNASSNKHFSLNATVVGKQVQ